MEINPFDKLRVNAEQSRSIKKAIIPIAGLGTRFLPLSKVLPKELWPLVDTPVIQFIVEEAAKSGIKEIIFVASPNDKKVLNYFKKNPQLEKILKEKKKYKILKSLKDLENLSKKISFSQVIQKEPLGDGHAILMAENLTKGKSCAVLFADDVVDAKNPCLKQLIKVFKKYKRPVMALCRVPKSSFQFYGMVRGKKVENRVYRIEKIVEKPSIKNSPSDLAIVGKHIITPDVFNYLKKSQSSKRGEMGLTETLAKMLADGKDIYGYEFEGKWLECGNKSAYLKSNFYLSLKHPQFGKELRKFLKMPPRW